MACQRLPALAGVRQYSGLPICGSCPGAQADEREDRGSGGNSLAGSSSDDRGAANKVGVCVAGRRHLLGIYGNAGASRLGQVHYPSCHCLPARLHARSILPCTAPCARLLLPQAATEVWLVSEFCNRSPLLTAIERGAFLTQPSSQYGQPNLISVLQVRSLPRRWLLGVYDLPEKMV